MSNIPLSCAVDAILNSTGEISLAFQVRNPSDQTINVRYFIPFTSFVVKADAEDGEVPILQPAYDLAVQPMSQSLGAGETLQIDTPIHLRFDPDAPPSGGDVPTQWTLHHSPTPVLLQVTLQIEGAVVEPCQVRVAPGA